MAPRRVALVLCGLALWSPRTQAACSSGTGVADLAIQLGRAEQAFVEMNPAGFRTQRELARETFFCLSEAMSPSTAEAWHQLQALDAFLVRDTESATRAFQAVFLSNPRYTLPPEIAPEGHPLWMLVQEAKGLPTGPTRNLEAPSGLILRVDGRVSTEVHDSLPAVLQLMNTDYAVAWTGDLRVGGSDPDWSGLVVTPTITPTADASTNETPQAVAIETEPPPSATDTGAEAETETDTETEALPLDVPPEPLTTRSRRLPLLAAGAGISALATGGLLVLADSQHYAYMDLDNTDIKNRDDLDALRTRNQLVVAGSAVTAVAAVGLTLGAVIAWRF